MTGNAVGNDGRAVPRKLQREDFPLVTTWTRNNYKAVKDTLEQDADDIDEFPSQFSFLQAKTGFLVSLAGLESIRGRARAFFADLNQNGTLPQKWNAPENARGRRALAEILEAEFEEVEYCDYSWKADQIAFLVFPSYRQHLMKTQKRKQGRDEGGSVHDDDEGVVPPPPAAKRLKIANPL